MDDFIGYKERCIQRLQYVEKNREAKHEAERLKQYLAELPRKDRSIDHVTSPFWPSNASNAPPVRNFPSEAVENVVEKTR